MTLPPASLVKKWKPRYRSSVSIASVAVRIGNAATISRLAASEVQQNIGIRIRLMPGARCFSMVATRLTPDRSVPTPEIWIATR